MDVYLPVIVLCPCIITATLTIRVFWRCWQQPARMHMAQRPSMPSWRLGGRLKDAAWEASVDDTLVNEAAPSVAATVEACCAVEAIDAINGVLNGTLEAVVIAAVGGNAANTMWNN
jgi:hypothetical protein